MLLLCIEPKLLPINEFMLFKTPSPSLYKHSTVSYQHKEVSLLVERSLSELLQKWKTLRSAPPRCWSSIFPSLWAYWHNLLKFTPCSKTYIETGSPIQPLSILKMQAQYPSDIQWQLPYTPEHQLQYGNDGSSLSDIAAFVQREKALPLLQIWTWASSSLHLWLTFCCTVSNTRSINVFNVCVCWLYKC